MAEAEEDVEGDADEDVRAKMPFQTLLEWYEAVRGLQAHFDSYLYFLSNRMFALLLLLGVPASLVIAVDARILPPFLVFVTIYAILFLMARFIRGSRIIQAASVFCISFAVLAWVAFVVPELNPETPFASEFAFLVGIILFAIVFFLLEGVFISYAWVHILAFSMQDTADRILRGKLVDSVQIEKRISPALFNYWRMRLGQSIQIAAMWNLRERKKIEHLPESTKRKILFEWLLTGLGEGSLSKYLKARRKAETDTVAEPERPGTE